MCYISFYLKEIEKLLIYRIQDRQSLYYLASLLPPTLPGVQLASSHKPQGLVLVHRPKLKNQQLRCILALKCFTRFCWTQPEVSTGRRFPLLVRHLKISTGTAMEGTMKYMVFSFILLLPHCQYCDYSKCSSPTASPGVFVSSHSLHHCEAAHLLCVPTFPFTVYKSSLVVSWTLHYRRKHTTKCRT